MFGKPKKVFILLALLGSFVLLGDCARAAVQDSDADGLTDQAERDIYLTDPRNPDTDNDDIGDGEEIIGGTNPKQQDISSLEMIRQATEGANRNWYNRFFFDAEPGTLWFYSFSSVLVLVLTSFQIRAALRKRDNASAVPVQNISPEKDVRT